MKIIHFLYKGKPGWGQVQDDMIKVLKQPPFVRIAYTKQSIPLNKIKYLPPADPQKIVLVGLNYKEHARELGMKIPSQPVIFLKPVTTLIGHNQKIKYPGQSKQVDYEAELALVIKQKAFNVPVPKAHKYILGYTCLNDVTARDLQKKDGQWTRAKSFDTFCPLGPWIETGLDPSGIKVSAYLNGKLKQSSSTSDLIFSVPELVSFISRIMTLMPGDIISTGTPPGVGRMKPKDTVEIAIDGIGRLKNTVTA